MTTRSAVNKKGFTLLEILIAVTVAAILVGAVSFTLHVCFESYMSGEREVRANKFLDGVANAIIYGKEDVEGIQSAMEIAACGKNFITYVPLWRDESHNPPYGEDEEYQLNKPYKDGSGQPIGEMLMQPEKRTAYFAPTPVIFRQDDNGAFVKFKMSIPSKSRIRVVYWPDYEMDSSVGATISWNPKDRSIVKTYKGVSEEVSVQGFRGLMLKDLEFHYYDNTGKEILPEPNGKIKDAYTHSITGIELRLTANIQGFNNNANIFVNLRNTRSGGAPIIIEEGSEIRLPNYKDVSILSIANISGVNDGDKIEMEIVPDDKSLDEWKITLELTAEGPESIIKSYTIEYPPGKVVYKERIFKSTEVALDLLSVGQDKYDYGYDSDSKDVVKMNCETTLKVIRMDCRGAAIFVRP